tara:strand:+ start:54 stop:314 length:261 start_codon:yes stop_codon:yes gene_type:complete
MRIPKEIAEDVFLDEDAQTVALCVDRVSLMLDLKEFVSLVERVTVARDNLVNDGVVTSLTVTAADDVDNIIKFKNKYKASDDEEYH